MQTKTPAFVPRRGLSGGHRQTLASFFLSRRIALPPAEARFIEVEPGVQVLAHCHWQSDRQKALTVIIVHGLEGSSDSQYVIGNGNKLWTAGANIIRMNMRNCGGTEHLTQTLYHSGLSGDVHAVVRFFTEQYGLQSLSLVGYSTPKAVLGKIIQAWQQTPDGKDASFNQSFGASTDQARAVANGLKADIVFLSTGDDVNLLVDAGLVDSNWNHQACCSRAWRSAVILIAGIASCDP